MKKYLLLLAGAILLPMAGYAEETTIVVSGQYRPRAEIANKGLPGQEEDVSVSHRARLNVDLTRGDWSFRFAPQDVRKWGSETNTLKDFTANGFDLHEAYTTWRPCGCLTLKAGRQEIFFDNHRIMGNVNWTQQARSFDGLRVSYARDSVLSGDLFAIYLKESGVKDTGMYGLHGTVKSGGLDGNLLAVVEETLAGADMVRATIGTYTNYSIISGLTLTIEGYGQFGKRGTDSIAAWMASAQAKYSLKGIGSTLLGSDFLSGDSDKADTTIAAFDTLYATNHKFYGLMDYFLAIPKQTVGYGLVDTYIKFTAPLGPVKARLDLHRFLTAVDTTAGRRSIGSEADLVLMHKINSHVKLVGGYSAFLSGSAFVEMGRATQSEALGHWAWLMLDTQF